MTVLQNKRVLLIISGGIAAYKTLFLIRDLRRAGAEVRVILTRSGAQFVTPLSVSALADKAVHQDLFSLEDEARMGHIALARWADSILVAPATADLLARAAHGLADDLATTVLLATQTPVLYAPAMNPVMWAHPAVRQNVRTLKARGARIISPEQGDMACGETGEGRMAEPDTLFQALETFCASADDQPLKGRKALVTAGPTRERLDPVRYMTNHSSGRQGYALASALSLLGAEVTLVSGPTELADPEGVKTVRVQSALEMLQASERTLPVDIAVCVAAVSDWRPAKIQETKQRKEETGDTLSLVKNPDILKTLSTPGPKRPPLVIGFAAETHDVLARAREKRLRKGCDWIVANDVSGDIMGGEETELILITPTQEHNLERMPKDKAAHHLARHIATVFKDKEAKTR